MKRLFTLILIAAFAASVWCQDMQTKPVWVVFDKQHKAVKVYAAVEDCIRFCNLKGYSNQQVNLYFRSDSSEWHPSNAIAIDDRQYPQPINDVSLAKKSVQVVMQKNFDTMADRAYLDATEAAKYAQNWKEKQIELPYLYRDKKSYDEVYRIKRQRLKK
jgi:hypothetical protein